MIIALSGKAGAGKDTVAQIISDNIICKHHYTCACLQFADPLKKTCRELFSLSSEQLYGGDKEVVDTRWGLSPRQLFQKLGSSIKKEYGEDHLVRLLRFKLFDLQGAQGVHNLQAMADGLHAVTPVFIVTDVRFLNEHLKLEEVAAELHVPFLSIRVEGREANLNDDTRNDISETNHQQIPSQFVVRNDSTLQALEYKLYLLLHTSFYSKS